MNGIDFSSLYVAEVLDNDDPQKQGRIKINIPPLMQGWSADHLPWARPFFNATGGDSLANIDNGCYTGLPNPNSSASTSTHYKYGESFIPEITSSVWVWFSDATFLKNPYYLTGFQIEGNSPHGSFYAKALPTFQGDSLPIDLTYPNVKFLHLNNQASFFKSAKADYPEYGYHFSRRSYFYVNEDRTTDQASKSRLRMKSGTDTFLDFTYDEATDKSKSILSADKDTTLQLDADRTLMSYTGKMSASSDTFVKVSSQTGGTQKNFLAQVGGPSNKIDIDAILGQISIVTSNLIQLQAAQITASGPINTPALLTSSIAPPPSSSAPLTLQGAVSPGPATDPAVMGVEFISTMSYVTSSLTSLAAAVNSLVSAVNSLSGAFLVINPAAVIAAGVAAAAASASAGSASSDAGNVTTTAATALSTNILIN